jgi:hypothetical protein
MADAVAFRHHGIMHMLCDRKMLPCSWVSFWRWVVIGMGSMKMILGVRNT